MTFTYKDSEIFYRIQGTGSPVMLLHGFGEDGRIWDKQAELLQEHHQLLIPDIPGSGQSTLLENGTIESYAEAMSALIKQVWPGLTINLVGHSMGGYITLALAENNPELLNSFGLFHSSAYADSDEKKSIRLKAIDFIRSNGAAGFLKASIPGLFTNRFKEQHPEEIDLLTERSKSFTEEALVQYYKAMIARPDRTHILRESTVPVLFIIGQQDTAVPFQHSLQQCYFPAQSAVHILRQSAHMGMLEETEKTNNALLKFFAGV